MIRFYSYAGVTGVINVNSVGERYVDFVLYKHINGVFIPAIHFESYSDSLTFLHKVYINANNRHDY